MSVFDVIQRRRSIRQYKADIPADEDIRKIIEAGIWAPSGLNNQPWKFKVLKEKEMKDGLKDFTTPRYAEIIGDAPVAICVFLDNSLSYNREKDIMSVGSCIQNILLEAYERGLGTCWLGEIINKKEEVQKYLATDPDYELMAVIMLGYSDEQVTQVCRKELDSFLI